MLTNCYADVDEANDALNRLGMDLSLGKDVNPIKKETFNIAHVATFSPFEGC